MNTEDMSIALKEREINDSLLHVDEYVRYEYLSVLDRAKTVPLTKEQAKIKPGSNLQLMQMQSFTFDREENIVQKIRSVYGALERSGTSAAIILDGRTDEINLYLGTFTDSLADKAESYRAFLGSFNGVFPGCSYKNIRAATSDKLLDELFNPGMDISVSAVSAFPGQESSDALAGLDVLIDGMKGRPFSMILIARAMDRAEIVAMRQGYESLYTQIAPLLRRDVSTSESKTETIGTSFSRALSESLSQSTGTNTGFTDTEGTSHGIQNGPDQDKQANFQAKTQLAGAALAAGASILGLAASVGTGGASIPVSRAVGHVAHNLFFGSALSASISSAATLAGKAPKPDTSSTSEGSHKDHSDTYSESKTETKGKTTTDTEGNSRSSGTTSGQTVQVSFQNKSVADLLDRLDYQIKEMARLENEGAFRVAAYFIAGDDETAGAAASLYRSIVTSGRGSTVHSPVYRWNDSEQTKLIVSSLERGFHPTFRFEGHPEYPDMSAAQPLGLSDLPTYLCFPQKSVYGLNVTEHASFARNVLLRDGEKVADSGMVRFGCIHHLGKDSPQTGVSISADTLTSHLFVAGATGVGKSNFCYNLINNLLSRNVKVLVIEPAKGEYAKVFGGRDDFAVYGTNLRQAPPLRINPFAFPEGVNCQEHIERLMDIFCAAWPMYSAMPAIMKEALEEIYHRQGFDDIWGDRPEGARFPNFADLLETLPDIIKSSKYSSEVQGNYTGALVTRVRSLTNGVYNIIFTDDELGDAALFDENVVIDISRIGSEETKSLIMGIIIMRLNEYRSCSGRMNSSLRHLTLLEEAHHLLGKQTSGGQDVGNMKAASVEMISNAIREMRTYGDSFVIADQSPAVMDSSVISNTHTKVFFMMPRKEDITIAGDAASLNVKQTLEIAKLPRGVAMVFQNEWSDPVLCKIDYFSPELYTPFAYDASNLQDRSKALQRMATIALLDPTEIKKEEIINLLSHKKDFALLRMCLPSSGKYIEGILRNACSDVPKMFSVEQKQEFLDALIGIPLLLKRSATTGSITEWASVMETQIELTTGLTAEHTRKVINLSLFYRAQSDANYRKLYTEYVAFCCDQTG